MENIIAILALTSALLSLICLHFAIGRLHTMGKIILVR